MNLVYEFLDKFNFNRDTSIVIGVSTGEDSMCLLNVLMNYRDNRDYKIIVAHINHKKRLESDEEEQFLELYCRSHNLIFESMSINEKIKGNFESEARKIRYTFYEDLINKYQAGYLLTAHHGDDLIETVMMRLTRGSSLKGYQGISLITHKDKYDILRPLLYITKEDIHEYIVNNNIPYRVDVTNFSDDYTRNRYRKNILPFLKKESLNVHLKFLKFSNKLEEANNYIENNLKLAYQECFSDKKINIDLFLKNDLFMQKLIIEKIFNNIYKDLSLVNDKHIDIVINFISNNKTGSRLSLPNNVIFTNDYGYITIKNVDISLNNDYCFELVDGLELPNKMKFIKIINEENGNDTIHLDSNLIALPLYVRNKKDGDFIELKGTIGKRKVKDIFIDSKIRKEDRDSYPVVVDSNNNIIWIPKLKKSKYDVQNHKSCDIIFKCL